MAEPSEDVRRGKGKQVSAGAMISAPHPIPKWRAGFEPWKPDHRSLRFATKRLLEHFDGLHAG